ncbi:MAG: CPBP family intramembrane metalloprotease, partial [Treponemataceae bacterium]|nr:CPBP family intramembrane metalloprotease [Treponemataceae bacterium]
VFLDFLFRGIFFVFSPSGTGKFRRVIMLAEFFKTFGLLCVIQAFFDFLGFVLKVHHGTIIYFPGNINVAQIFSWATALFSAAFYEETLYRAYLPFSLKKIFRKKHRSQNGFSNAENEIKAETNSAQGGKRIRFFDAAFEIAAIAIFGFSHLQNGILAVANALVAGFFLRRCAVRTGGIKVGFFAHFLYNALTLVLMMAVGFAIN